MTTSLWRVVASAGILAAAIESSGCASSKCGIGLSPAEETDGGYAFQPLAVGSFNDALLSIQDTANVDETITSASLTGTDAQAFDVISTFPLAIPAGTSGIIQVRFAPDHKGALSADLVLETAAMGPSPISLSGVGQ